MSKSSPTASQRVLPLSRRRFIRTTSVGMAGAALLSKMPSVGSAYGTAGGTLRVALIGCGLQGIAAIQRILGHPSQTCLVAVADLFEDRIASCLTELAQEFGVKVDVPAERRFVGFDAFRQAMAAADVVVLATPPGFRPSQFEEAVVQGKHVFMEAPVATDAPGVRRVLAATAAAKQKNLKVTTAFQRRYDPGTLETVQRLKDGAIGSIPGMRCLWNTAPSRVQTRETGETEMRYQVRNWSHFVWLSGDQVCEQLTQVLDIANWVKGTHPIRCWGSGGRQVCISKEYGESFDHFALEYEYADGTLLFADSRQIPGCWNQIGAICLGTLGTADCLTRSIRGPSPWSYGAVQGDAYRASINTWLNAIQNGLPMNDAEEAAYSTMTGILGRLATYSGKEVSWDQAFNSKIDLFPAALGWDKSPKVIPGVGGGYPIPVPGVSVVV